ncbi:MAG: CARDB domain-containing protein, partial [Desulfosudaceae bacterium]
MHILTIGKEVLFYLCLFISFFLLPPQLFASEYVVNTVDHCGDVTVMELSGEMDVSRVDGSYSAPVQAISNEFFASHADKYDFLVIFSGFDFEMPETDNARGFYCGIKNDVQGIGIEPYDNSPLYGSDSRLQGAVVMGCLDDKVTDALSPEFSTIMGTLSHELLHRWGCYATFQDENNEGSQALLGKNMAHWSFLLDTDGSLMYGNQWHDNGNGTFTSLPGHKYYSPLDLYLMGLVDKTEVPPMLLIDNPEIDPKRLPVAGETISGTARTVTIEDIIAAEGERIPSAENAQKQFRIGTVLIVRPGMYQQSQVARIRTVMSNWVMWYSALTDGRSQVILDSTATAELPENPGIENPEFDPREAPPEIRDGVTWLQQKQDEDGSWSGETATARRETIAVLRLLEHFPEAASSYAAGLEWLETGISDNSDNLAGTVEVLARSNESGPDLLDELVTELLARQNDDGGWGADRKKYKSNPLDTACVLVALAAAGEDDDSVVSPAVDYLVAAQDAAGGWKCEAYEDDIRTTTLALRALFAFQNMEVPAEVREKGLAWLYGKQNPDGGFGNSASTVEDTALAVTAMQPLSADPAGMSAAQEYLRGFQGADGSWYDDTYQTALAVSALWLTGHKADLSVATEDVSFTPASITSLPCDLTIQAEIRNHGLNPVSETTVALYREAIAAGNKIAEQVIAVDGNAAVPVTFSVAVTQGGTHRFYIQVDGENRVEESNESNNAALKLLSTETTYDFEILDADVSVSPDTVEVLTALTLTARIRNKGAATAYNVPLSWYADGGEIFSTNVDTLPAGQEITKEITWQAVKSGTYPLTAVIDPEDFYPEELSENNNSGSAVLTVSPVNQPNLVVRHTELTVSPNPLLQGAAAEIAVPVVNNGFAPAENIQARAYDGVPGEGGTLIGRQTIDALPAGESRPVNFSWAEVAEAGEHLIYVDVSAAGAEEIRQDDNNAFVSVDALSLPDLAVSPGAIAVEPPVAREGDPVEISVSVQNAGQQTVPDLAVGLFQDGRLLESRRITSLPGNSQAQARFVYDTTGSPGAQEITVKVDPDNLVAEQSETNNTASRAFGVQNADLWLTEPYISPNGDGVKDETRFFFTLDARQTVRVAVVNEDRQEVRTFGGELYQEVTGGDVI